MESSRPPQARGEGGWLCQGCRWPGPMWRASNTGRARGRGSGAPPDPKAPLLRLVPQGTQAGLPGGTLSAGQLFGGKGEVLGNVSLYFLHFSSFLEDFFFIMRKSKMRSLRPSSSLGRGRGLLGETASPPDPVGQFPGFLGTVPCFLLRFDPCASAVGEEDFSFILLGSLAALISKLI